MFFLGPRRLSTPLLSATFEKSEARGAADIDMDPFFLKKKNNLDYHRPIPLACAKKFRKSILSEDEKLLFFLRSKSRSVDACQGKQ